MAATSAAVANAGDAGPLPLVAAAGGRPDGATAAGTAPGTATAADAAAASSKWHAYYASDPASAPWDTHGASSQLRSYLCGCADVAAQGGAQGTADAGQPAGGGGAALTLHACQRCASIKPPALVEWLAAAATAAPTSAVCSSQTGAPGLGAVSDSAWPTAAAAATPLAPLPRALELCCGTGGSLAFMRSQGFHVVGVELVEAACALAAERLAAAAAAAAGPSTAVSGAAVTRDGSGRVVVEAVRGAAAGCGDASVSGSNGSGGGSGAEKEGVSPEALLLHGDLFAAAASGQIAPQSFDFVYDCQGLHAMPPELRPGYVRVVRDALRPGGTALVLVGRREEDGEVEAAAAAAGVAAVAAVAAAAAGEAAGGGNASAEASRPGPSLMGLSELRSLFPGGCGKPKGFGDDGSGVADCGGSESRKGEEGAWEWLGCRATRFDWTPVYRQRPVAPPAWCLLLRRC